MTTNPDPASPGSRGSRGSVPFPQSRSDTELDNPRLSSESQDHFDVQTTVEPRGRFETIVRTVIASRRARRGSAPEARPVLDQDIPLRDRRDSATDGHDDGGRGLGLAVGGPSEEPYSSIGGRLASGELDALHGAKRVSFEGDERPAFLTRVLSPASRASDPLASTFPPRRSSPPSGTSPSRRPATGGRTTSPTRAALTGSPLLKFLRARRKPEDLFIARDPYHWKFSHSHPQSRHLPQPHLPTLPPSTPPLTRAYLAFLLKQIYICFLLRLPSLYFSRVGRLFEEADLTKKEMERIIRCMHSPEWEFDLEIAEGGGQSEPLKDFKESWEDFVDHIIKEWKTLNIVSALLLTAILTLFQIEAASAPVTHTCGLLALIFALQSLVLGCMYIIRFQTMRTMQRAAKWAEAAQATSTNPIWNVWIFLALPAVYLAWSLVLFIVTILSYTWTADPVNGPATLSPRSAVAERVVVTVVAFIGAVALGAVLRTFQSYSEPGPVPEVFGSSPRLSSSGLLSPRASNEAQRTDETTLRATSASTDKGKHVPG